MSEAGGFVPYKDWLIRSTPTGGGKVGYTACVNLAHTDSSPGAICPDTGERTYPTWALAYYAGIKMGKVWIDSEGRKQVGRSAN